jgi:hypothetical protein
LVGGASGCGLGLNTAEDFWVYHYFWSFIAEDSGGFFTGTSADGFPTYFAGSGYVRGANDVVHLQDWIVGRERFFFEHVYSCTCYLVLLQRVH